MSYEKSFDIVTLTPQYDPSNGEKIGDQPIIIETISAEIQPFSTKLAELQYGTSVNVTNRMFCDPTTNLVFGSKGRYKGKFYLVTALMDFDEHYEVLLELIQ